MKTSGMIELHCHTKMSAWKGLIEPKELIRYAYEKGYKAIAITDCGNVQAFPEVYRTWKQLWEEHKKECMAKGMEPDKLNFLKVIYGLEGYITDDNERSYPVLIYAKNETGIRNLYKIVTASQLEYFDKVPLIRRNLLDDNRDGLLVGSINNGGEVYKGCKMVIENFFLGKNNVANVLEDYSMYGTGTKKMLNMLILDILKEYSDSEHRLLQQDIIDLLKSNYGIECKRRAVCNNINSLKEMGYDIVADKGYYLRSRDFTDAELRLLIDSIFSSAGITDKEAHHLVKKIEKFSNKYFKSHVSHIHTSSSGMNAANLQVMDSIAIIDTAISKDRKISFSYLQYGIDFKLHPKRRERYVASPYQMINHRGRYYLIANYDGKDCISNFRIDRFSDVQILEENRNPLNSFEGYKNGLDLSRYFSEHVYMYGGKSIHVKFRMNERFMDNLVDSFGMNFRADPDSDEEMIVSLKSNPDAFFYWAMQYGQNIEVLEPENMRERILKACKEIEAKYKKE